MKNKSFSLLKITILSKSNNQNFSKNYSQNFIQVELHPLHKLNQNKINSTNFVCIVKNFKIKNLRHKKSIHTP